MQSNSSSCFVDSIPSSPNNNSSSEAAAAIQFTLGLRSGVEGDFLPPRLPDVAGFDSAYLVLATSMVLEGGAIGADHWRLPNLRKGSTIVIEYD